MTSKILGTGSYIPVKKVMNQELVDGGLNTSDEWIISHTGILSRHIADPSESTSDLSVFAARRALEDANIKATDLCYIICTTSTPDKQLPATASLIQHKLGASCGAIDVNAACSGFVHALSIGMAISDQNNNQPVLVIGADTYSKIIDWSDRTTAVFFGDGAGAAVIGKGLKHSKLLSITSGSAGAAYQNISLDSNGFFQMDGRLVWDFVVKKIPELIKETISKASLNMSDIDLIIPHQANAQMLRVISDTIGIAHEKVFINIDKYANTAAASVAIALDEAVKQKRILAGHNVLIVGFGAGFSWCSICLKW